MATRPFVIGLTGAFGSGCTTAANYLSELPENPYLIVKLSDFLRNLWADEHPEVEPSRNDLQDLGDRLRHEGGLHAVVAGALNAVEKDENPPDRIVIDAIRNLGEVRWLQDTYGDQFSLFAMYANSEERFRRYRDEYDSEESFLRDDQRDRGETTDDWGQQVARCVDNADIFIINDENLDPYERDELLQPKLARYVAIAEGRGEEYPSVTETLMNLAFSASAGSKCLKRQVGAIVAKGAEPWSTGFNENPDGMKPCVEEFNGTCYRDRVRQDRYTELYEEGAHCPGCGEKLAEEPSPPWKCGKCGERLDRYFFPDRAMWWCTALHAEHRAIINAGDRDLRDCTLYTTTFPCPQCAEQIIHAGIPEIVYMEAYPDETGKILLENAKVTLRLFEGVRSRNFHRAFSGVQATKEREAVERVRAKISAKQAQEKKRRGSSPEKPRQSA